jgi:hypothetical protein
MLLPGVSTSLRDIGHVVRKFEIKPDLAHDEYEPDQQLPDLRLGEIFADAQHVLPFLKDCDDSFGFLLNIDS